MHETVLRFMISTFVVALAIFPSHLLPGLADVSVTVLYLVLDRVIELDVTEFSLFQKILVLNLV